jgi:hypothetical protein
MDLKPKTHFNKGADQKTHHAFSYSCLAIGASRPLDRLCSGIRETYLSKISCCTENHDLVHGTNLYTMLALSFVALLTRQ